MSDFEKAGFTLQRIVLSDALRKKLRTDLFQPGKAGERCLLDHPAVREAANNIAWQLAGSGHLPESAIAIQAIAFDKSADSNWKVAWHQDLMFPFAENVTAPNFDLGCVKHEVHYARPPVQILQSMLAVRLHLDDCDETNGPLRVSPGTHLFGIIPVEKISGMIDVHGSVTCTAVEGEALIMRPLLLHASSQALEPKHRRVLHFVYAPDNSSPEPWHRALAHTP